MAWAECFEPLRIRAYLRCGVVADRWLPLDGVLFYQAMRDRFGDRDVTVPGAYVPGQEAHVSMPLEIAHPGTPFWYYRCSWAQWSHDVEGRDHWNKRFDSKFADLLNFGGRRGKVIVEQGKYKAYHMPIFYRVAEYVEWYAVGDKKQIEYLLSTVTHLGKKCSQGWGRARHFEVERCPQDWSVWCQGHLMRGVPVEDGPTDRPVNLMHYGIRPSYWNQANQMMLVKPDEKPAAYAAGYVP